MPDSREDVYRAKLAKQAERYEGLILIDPLSLYFTIIVNTHHRDGWDY